MEEKTSMAEVYGHLHKKVLKLDQKSSLFLFFGKIIVNNNWKVKEMHQKYKGDDGILYIQYSDENPFWLA